jgi:hypothetical protein
MRRIVERMLACGSKREMVRPAGFEPATSGLEVPRSIQLSYGRVEVQVTSNNVFSLLPLFVERPVRKVMQTGGIALVLPDRIRHQYFASHVWKIFPIAATNYPCPTQDNSDPDDRAD